MCWHVLVCVTPGARCVDHSERDRWLKVEGVLLFFLHGLELVDPLLCVALPDLSQGLVFVSAGLDVLTMKKVILGALGFVARLSQLFCQGLRATKEKRKTVKFYYQVKHEEKEIYRNARISVNLNLL